MGNISEEVKANDRRDRLKAKSGRASGSEGSLGKLDRKRER